MSSIGNPINSAMFLVDTFSGNTSTTQFTMSVAPASTSSILVSISGVVQDPATYTVNGTTLTFTGAPPTGSGNISVRYLGLPAIVGVPSDGTVTTNKIVDQNVTTAKLADANVTRAKAATDLLGVAQSAQSSNYTLALTDVGGHVYSANSGAQTITVPTNATVALPVGASVTLVNNGTTAITISTTGTTVYQAGTANTGNRTLATKGLATLLKVATDTWFITGVGLT
jgi:hypothetical protein